MLFPFQLYLVVFSLITLYQFILILRVVLDLVQIFARDWAPRGLVLIVANLIYRLTDPPLRFLGKYIPPIRFGAVAFDLAFLVLFLGLSIIGEIIPFLFLF